MKVKIQVIIESDDGRVQDVEEVACLKRGTLSPQELSNLADLFTPQFVLNQLTELVDRGASDAQLAQQMRHLRPWLTAGRFSQRSANRRLLASLGGAE